MKNTLNKKSELLIEKGVLIGGASFTLISAPLLYVSFQLQIPLVQDITWSEYPDLAKVIWSYLLHILNISTTQWSYHSFYLEIYGLKTLFFWHFYMPLLISFSISGFIGYQCAKPIDKYHARGGVVISGTDAINYAKRKIKYITKNLKIDNLPSGLLLHPKFRSPAGAETKGLALIGSPNAGKSQIVTKIIFDMLQHQPHAKACLVDIKGDYTSLINSNVSIITALWDSRSRPWAIGLDIRTDLEAAAFASAMIPLTKGENEIFIHASRLLFTAHIVCLQSKHGINWDWRLLLEQIQLSRGQSITEFKKYYPLALKIYHEESKTTDSIEFTLISNLSHLKQYAEAWPSTNGGFSLTEWIKDDSDEKPILLLQLNKAFPTLSDTYICAILNVLSQLILSPSFQDSSSRRVHFILDEIAQLPYLEQLKNLCALGRSKGICVWLGIQDFDLLVDKYGQHEVNSLIGMMQTKIILSMGSGTGADFASKLIGDRELFTHDFDENGTRIPLTQTQRLVTASEINQLPQPTLQHGIHGWMTVTGWDAVLQLTWPITKFEKVREGIKLAEWVDQIPVTNITNHVAQATVSPSKKLLIKKTKNFGDAS